MKLLRMESHIALIALISLSFVVFLGKSDEVLLRGIDSNIHAKAALNVTHQKRITPTLPIADVNTTITEPESYFNDHPFFAFWLNGWVMRTLGPSAWSARLLTATFSVGCVLLTLALGTILYSRLFGFLSALFFLFARDVVLTGATVSLDPPMLFCILLSFLLWTQEKWLWMGLVTGIGLWIKTPVVLLVFPTAFFTSLIRGRLQKDTPKLIRSAAIALGIGSFVWIATGWIGGRKLVEDYWIRQVWGTAVGGRNLSNPFDPWSLLRMLRSGFLPSLPFLVVGVFQIIRKKLWNHPIVVISTVAFAAVALSITPLKFRMDYYFNPVFPFLALLSAFSVIDWIEPYEKNFYLALPGIVLSLLAFLLCTPTPLAPETFVALKRFMPFIQTYGQCRDEILLVPGGEPVGSSLDYRLVLNFYTGHTVDVQECTTAGAAVRRDHPSWVLISKEHLTECLTAEERAKYPTHLKMGDQYLLSTLIPSGSVVDLSPLERELKPSVDCKAPPYPKDRYHRGFSTSGSL